MRLEIRTAINDKKLRTKTGREGYIETFGERTNDYCVKLRSISYERRHSIIPTKPNYRVD